MNLYISDLHLGHKNVIRYDQRPFSDIDEMDRVILQLWNGRVREEDHVYVAGDFAYRNVRPAEWYLRQMKGHKHLIVGNHDGKLLQNEAAMGYFESVDKMLHVTDGEYQICICHYPVAEWNGYFKGHWHIYGHIHNRKEDTYSFMKTRERALNAGCMINGFAPVSFRELLENNRKFKHEELYFKN